jgi:hypothetical protein
MSDYFFQRFFEQRTKEDMHQAELERLIHKPKVKRRRRNWRR